MLFPAFAALNIAAILILGAISSHTDLKKGMIHNKVVFPAIAVGFALNYLNGFPFEGFLINGFLAFFFGLALWLPRFWTAGDSKLFLAFALLFPMGLYPAGQGFPALSIIVNSFVPAFAVMLVLVLLRTTLEQKKKALAKAFSKRTVFSTAVFLFAFYFLLKLLFSSLSIQLDFFSATVLIFALVSLFEFLFPRKTVYVFAALSGVLSLIYFSEIATLQFAINFALWIFLFLLLVFFVVGLGIFAFGKKVLLKDLKPGMVLLDSVVEKGNVLKRKEPFYPSLVNILSAAKEKRLIASGTALTSYQISMLRKKHSKGVTHFDMLMVQETLPFAPILFIGVLLTLALAFL